MRRSLSCALVLASILCLVPSVEAARVRERVVELRLEGESFVRSERLQVLIENGADVREWQRYALVVDEATIELLSFDARVLDEAGKVVEKVPKRKLEEGGAARSSGELFSSYRLLYARFDELAPGRVLQVEVSKRHTPVFAGMTLGLDLGDPQDRLRVRVAPGFPGLRWHLRGDPELFVVRELDGGGLELVAEGIEAFDPPAHAPSTSGGLLMLAWGSGAEWADVGRWYEAFAPAGEPTPEVRALAARLTANAVDLSAKAEALVEHVQHRVRYVAVQIGEGGWRPSPAEEVIGRGWGDCKDKSRLLLDLLAAVGVRGHMALLRVADSGHVDPAFPTAFQFNHAIVALPVSELAPKGGEGEGGDQSANPTAPISGGLLWIDPTASTGGLEWLIPSTQDRWALVVDGDASRLERTPRRLDLEQTRVELRGEVAEDGGFSGELALRLSGARALWWIERTEGEQEKLLRASFDDFLKNWWPGAHAGELRWERAPSPAPALNLFAEVNANALVRGEPGRRWLMPPSLDALPEPRHLAERTLPVALDPGSWTTRWDLGLPAGWCPAAAASQQIDKGIGRLEESIATVGGRLLFSREAVVHRDLAEGEAIAELEELAIAESRAMRRRIRLKCAQEASERSSSAASPEAVSDDD